MSEMKDGWILLAVILAMAVVVGANALVNAVSLGWLSPWWILVGMFSAPVLSAVFTLILMRAGVFGSTKERGE